MKIQELAAVAFRIAALIFGFRSLTYLAMLIPIRILDGFEREMLIQFLLGTLAPFLLFFILAVILWFLAGRLGRAVVPAGVSATALSGFSVPGVTTAALAVTGLTVGATSLPKIVETGYKLFFMKDFYFHMDPYLIGEMLGALTGLAIGAALFFGSGRLSAYLEQKNI